MTIYYYFIVNYYHHDYKFSRMKVIHQLINKGHPQVIYKHWIRCQMSIYVISIKSDYIKKKSYWLFFNNCHLAQNSNMLPPPYSLFVTQVFNVLMLFIWKERMDLQTNINLVYLMLSTSISKFVVLNTEVYKFKSLGGNAETYKKQNGSI